MTQRPVLERLWGTNSEKEDPTIYEDGWVYKTKPKHQDLNYLQNSEDDNTLSNMQDGVPYWRSNVSYLINSLVKFEGKIFTAIKANLNVTPVIGEVWGLSLLNYGLVELSDLIREIDGITTAHSIDYTNPHKVVASQTGAYSYPEFEAIISNVSGDLTSHVEDKDNPHVVTYSEIGILPKGGGVMKWMDFAQNSLMMKSINSLYAEGNYALYLQSKSRYAIGLYKSEARVVLGTSWQDLIHTGNILAERTLIEPQYAVPPPDMQAKLTSTLDTKYCQGGAQTTGIATFNSDGVNSDATINFDLPSDFIGLNQTVTCQLTNGATFTLGNIVFSAQVDSNLKVTDGAIDIYTGINDGHFVFVKTATHSIVYKDGLQVAKVDEVEPIILQCNLTSGGRAKNIQVWASALTPEQVKMI